MISKLHIVSFDRSYQKAAQDLINKGLGEHFGFIDESLNPDLFDIESAYGEGDFLLAFFDDQVVGTGALMPINTQVGQIARMHTASGYRRQGVASELLRALEQCAESRRLSSLILETNLDWDDANAFYTRNGYLELGRSRVGIRYRKTLETNC